MKSINFSKENLFNTAILIKETALNQSEIQRVYIDKMDNLGMNTSQIVAVSLEYKSAKPNKTQQKEYLNTLLPSLDNLGITDLFVCDSEYFKTLTGNVKAEPFYGYVLPCTIPEYTHMNVILCPNHQALFYKPDMEDKVDLAVQALVDLKDDSYVELGKGIIHSGSYPQKTSDISNVLDSLHQYDTLAVDIETFSLKHYLAGIGSIGFAWDKHNGTAFLCDYKPLDEPEKVNGKVYTYGENVRNNDVRKLLYDFILKYEGTLIWHNASFDCTILAYQLFMDNIIDYEGMIEGVKQMTKKIHDTKIITYLATNSCTGNSLGLKDQAHEFAGNYAVDVKDITKVPAKELLEYNLVDCLSTWYVFEKHYQTMVDDDQLDIYENLMLPSIKTIVQMQLTGMCMDMNQVLETEKTLNEISENELNTMYSLQFIKDYELEIRQRRVDADNKKLKTKVRTLDEVAHIKFNPNSNPQLQELLYSVMGLPVIDYTNKKQPATGGKTLKKLLNHATDPDHKKFLEALIGFGKVDKILSAFIPSFKEAPQAPDGYHYLFGSFNLGGTVSGRLSSNNPNLQQINLCLAI